MAVQNQHSDFTTFRDYYTGKMTPEQKSDFEKNLEQDPFAKEAFEGFLLLENDLERISTIENANMVFKKKFGINESSNSIPFKTILSIAATLIVLLGTYFFIQNNPFGQNADIAENNVNQQDKNVVNTINEPEKEFTEPEILDTEEISFNDTTVVIDGYIKVNEDKGVKEKAKDLYVNDDKEKKKNITSNNSKKEKNRKQISEADYDYYRKLQNNNSRNNTEQAIVSNDASTGIGSSSSEELKSVKPSNSYTNTAYYNDEELTESPKKQNISEYKKGIEAYNKSEYVKAIKFFNNSISQNKSVNSSNYYIAMAYFNQNKSSKAIKYFDKAIKSSPSFRDRAMWYKSLSLLRKGQKGEAKNLLNQIVNSNSIFKNSAENKLKNL